MVLLVATGIVVVALRNLLASALVLGIYSLLMAALWVVLDAVDVAFTEAAVGAGITTVLMLLAIALTGRREKDDPPPRHLLPITAALATGAALIYATADMPGLGDPSAPAQQHVAPYYIANAEAETSVPNLVTAVLAAYRGFDTLGEVTVIFTAGIGVLVLLTGGVWRRREHKDRR